MYAAHTWLMAGITKACIPSLKWISSGSIIFLELITCEGRQNTQFKDFNDRQAGLGTPSGIDERALPRKEKKNGVEGDSNIILEYPIQKLN